MLRGCWLLTDLDGTVIPTPHKAHGRYVALNEGPAIGPLQRWLKLGGNICIITTADRRVFEQVFVPLRQQLKSVSEEPQQHSTANNYQEASGELLLSMCTGTVLYRAFREGLHLDTRYFRHDHGGLRMLESKDSNNPPTYPTTCIDPVSGDVLFDVLCEIFLQFARDVIFEVPAALEGLTHLSKRYKSLWNHLLHYLSASYQRRIHHSAAASSSTANDGIDGGTATSKQQKQCVWKYEYLKNHRQILHHVGIVRREVVHGVPKAFQIAVPNRNEIDTSEVSSSLGARGTSFVPSNTKDGVSTTSSSIHLQFVSETQELLGVEQDEGNDSGCGGASGKKHYASKRKSGSTASPAIQMIIVGMPMKLYASYFSAYEPLFEKLGVTAIAQPNSVVFSRKGIGKATTIRYLQQPSSSTQLPPGPIAHDIWNLAPHQVDLRKSVALGDNPATADRELTVFPELTFVSVERDEQRDKRVSSVPALPNLLHVGGEEIGTSLFLDHLMDLLLATTSPNGGCNGEAVQRALKSAAEAVRNRSPSAFSHL